MQHVKGYIAPSSSHNSGSLAVHLLAQLACAVASFGLQQNLNCRVFCRSSVNASHTCTVKGIVQSAMASWHVGALKWTRYRTATVQKGPSSCVVVPDVCSAHISSVVC